MEELDDVLLIGRSNYSTSQKLLRRRRFCWIIILFSTMTCCLLVLFPFFWILLIIFIILVLLMVCKCSFYDTLIDHGYERKFITHFGGGRRENSVPLFICLHGGGGNAFHMMRNYGFREACDRYGCISVFPEGLSVFPNILCTWNCGQITSYEQNDVEFLNKLIEKLLRDFEIIDPNRIFMLGHSNGAMMAYRYATLGQHQINTIIPISGSVGSRIAKTNRWYRPPAQSAMKVNVLIVHGEQDRHVKINGGETETFIFTQRSRLDLSMNDSVEYWMTQNEAKGKTLQNSKVVQSRDMNGEFILREYSECENGLRIRSLTMPNGGHMWKSMNSLISGSMNEKVSFCRGSNNLAELIVNLALNNTENN